MLRSLLPLLLVVAAARAQLPHARLDRLFPLGGAAGSSVIVTVQGRDLDDLTTLRIDRPGFKVEKLKANEFRLTLPADAAAGTVEVRTIGRFGISAPRLFAVERGLKEVAEKEPNDTPATAQEVPLDSAINGTSDGEGDDHYRFRATKGQRVVLDCQALRLDSTLRATLVLSDEAGKELVRSRPYFHRTDPLLDFVAPADGNYVVQLHDATYAGGLPYRLLITTRPHVEAVVPAAVRAGQKATLTVHGRNLPGGKPADKLLDLPLDRAEAAFTAPLRTGRLDFLRHPPAASIKARAAQLLPFADAVSPATVLISDDPVIEEKEPNDTAATAQPITLPCTIAGRLDRPGDVDWYSFQLEAGETVAVEAWGERLERPGDLFLIVTDEKGNELAQPDDHGINFNALALFNRDPVGTFRAATKGTYRLMVQDRYRQGGPRHTYAVRVGRPTPEMYPVVFHATNPHPTCPLVRAGGSDHLEVCLNRRHFSGPVVIEAKGLPAGVSCPPVHVSPQTEQTNVVFTAAPNAKDWEGAITLEATAVVDGKKLTRPVACVQRRWAIDNINTSRACREVCLAVRPAAPYGVTLPATADAVQGKPIDLTVQVRRSPGFTGKVQLTGLNLPPGFGLATVDVPEGKAEGTARLTVAGNVPPGRYSIALRGDAQVPFSHEGKGKANVRVADASTPVTVAVAAAKK